MSRRQFNQVRSCFVRISAIMTVRLSYVLLYADNVEKKKISKACKKKKKKKRYQRTCINRVKLRKDSVARAANARREFVRTYGKVFDYLSSAMRAPDPSCPRAER